MSKQKKTRMSKRKKTRRSAKPYDKQAPGDSGDTTPPTEPAIAQTPGPSDIHSTESSEMPSTEPSAMPSVESFATHPLEPFDVLSAGALTVPLVGQSIISSTESSPGPSIMSTSAPTPEDPDIPSDPPMQTHDGAIINGVISNELPVMLLPPEPQPLKISELYARYPLLASFSVQMARDMYLKAMGPAHMVGIARIRNQFNRLPYPLGCTAAIERTDFTLPTHILGVQSLCAMILNPEHNSFMYLTPVHDFVLYLTCANIPNLLPSQRLDYMHIVPLAVPCPPMLPILLEYLTSRCTGVITDSLLNYEQIYGLYWNACTLGVQDHELYSLLDRLFLGGGTQLYSERHALLRMGVMMEASWNDARMRTYFQYDDPLQDIINTGTGHTDGMVLDDVHDNNTIIGMDATYFANPEVMDIGYVNSTI